MAAKKPAKNSSHSAPARKAGAKNPPASPPPGAALAPEPSDPELAGTVISLSEERIAQLTEEARTFSGKVLSFPGKLRARLKHLGLMARAARGDAAELVKTPFHDEPSLTHDEIARFGERVAFLRWTESNRRRFQGARK